MAYRAELGSLQNMSQSRTRMYGELLITQETRSCKINEMGKHYICCVGKTSFLYSLADIYKKKVYSYEDIEGASLEMVGMRSLFFTRNVDKERHFHIFYIIYHTFLNHLQKSDS
ncbi:hypothetical protein V8G54_003298 [Vigna mungo]|uniref:Uncharacterized protein n=1 Tax=Vigna mungo TaxID=3915 RepID=A0AAQ3SDZ8_VIGMU